MNCFNVGEMVTVKKEFQEVLINFGLDPKKNHEVDGINYVVIPVASHLGHIKRCRVESYFIIRVVDNSRWFYADMFQQGMVKKRRRDEFEENAFTEAIRRAIREEDKNSPKLNQAEAKRITKKILTRMAKGRRKKK